MEFPCWILFRWLRKTRSEYSMLMIITSCYMRLESFLWRSLQGKAMMMILLYSSIPKCPSLIWRFKEIEPVILRWCIIRQQQMPFFFVVVVVVFLTRRVIQNRTRFYFFFFWNNSQSLLLRYFSHLENLPSVPSADVWKMRNLRVCNHRERERERSDLLSSERTEYLVI